MNKILASKHRFKLMTPKEVMNLPDPRWIITEVLPAEVVAQVYGESGSYKSFITLDMALAVATGSEWLGKHTTIQSKVVYVAGEGVVGYKKRIKSWLKDNQLKIDVIEDTFRFLPEALPLNNSEDCAVFLHKVKEFVGKDSVDLIVLDTQARCTTGVEENSNTEMGVVISQLDSFKRELDATILLVHHTGKIRPGDRGASAVKSALDTQFSVIKDKNNKMVVTLKCTKQKDWEDGWDEKILMTPLGESLVISKGDSQGLATTALSWSNLSPKRKRVLNVLQTRYFNGSSEGLSYSDWLNFAEPIMSKAGFIKTLSVLKDSQLIIHNDEMYIPAPGIPSIL